MLHNIIFLQKIWFVGETYQITFSPFDTEMFQFASKIEPSRPTYLSTTYLYTKNKINKSSVVLQEKHKMIWFGKQKYIVNAVNNIAQYI